MTFLVELMLQDTLKDPRLDLITAVVMLNKERTSVRRVWPLCHGPNLRP